MLNVSPGRYCSRFRSGVTSSTWAKLHQYRVMQAALLLDRLLRDCPTINDYYFTIHKAVAIANHERRILGQFFRAAQAAG